jgi:hypothetical protein
MTTYKIIESTMQHFKGIEMPYDFSEYKVGDKISILGLEMLVMQCGTEIVGCSNNENILIFQKTNP